MVLASREAGKLTETNSSDLQGLPRGTSRKLTVLFGSDLTLNLDLRGRARIVCNVHWQAPHQRLNPAGSGVIFAAVEERQLQA